MQKIRVLKTNIEDHLKGKPANIIDLYKKLQSRLVKLENVEPKATDPYIGYKLILYKKRHRLFVEVHLQNNKIELHLRNLDYKNNTGIVIREAPVDHKWTLNKLVDIYEETDLDAILSLINQSYNSVLC